MSKTKEMRAIQDLINQSIAQAVSDTKYETYRLIKDLEDTEVEPDEILKIVKAFLVGRKREEMLFDV